MQRQRSKDRTTNRNGQHGLASNTYWQTDSQGICRFDDFNRHVMHKTNMGRVDQPSKLIVALCICFGGKTTVCRREAMLTRNDRSSTMPHSCASNYWNCKCLSNGQTTLMIYKCVRFDFDVYSTHTAPTLPSFVVVAVEYNGLLGKPKPDIPDHYSVPAQNPLRITCSTNP